MNTNHHPVTANADHPYGYADLHCDMLYAAWKKGAEDIWEMEGAMADGRSILRGGCRLQLYAVFMPDDGDIAASGRPWTGDDDYIRFACDAFRRTLARHGDVLAPAVSMADVDRNAAAGRVSLMLSMEDGRAVQGSLEKLRRLYDLGIRVMGLTWNHANCFGFPNSPDPGDMAKGLTDFGKESIPFMEDLGMVIDVSHLSDGGFWDVAKICRKPFIASHSNCRALNPHPRSLTDDMIRALADRGGVMGLNFCPNFLSQNTEQTSSSLEELALQLRHRINVGGLDCAAIGTDFDGISGDLEISSAAQMPFFFDSLLKRGFTPRELDRISFANVHRVFREICP